MKTTNTSLTEHRGPKNRLKAAFSLIELLVVIAVIGIIAAIAIPNIGNLTAGADTAKDQRNAQQLVSVYSAAVAAGHTPAGDEPTAVGEITGALPLTVNGATFHVPGMDAADVTSAQTYIGYANGTLTYTP